MDSEEVVTPEKTGVQEFSSCMNLLDSGFRRNDENGGLTTYYEFIEVNN
jgi:hypothetical protein